MFDGMYLLVSAPNVLSTHPICRDSAFLYPAPNLTLVQELEPILRTPLSVAVQVGANELAQK